MSLLLWLPLDGSLKNNGLGDLNALGRSLIWDDTKSVINYQSSKFSKDPNNVIYVPNAPTPQNSFSWSCWLYFDPSVAETSIQYVLSQGRDFGNVGLSLRIEQAGASSSLMIEYGKSSVNRITIASNIERKWMHVTIVVTQTQIITYINGTKSTTNTNIGFEYNQATYAEDTSKSVFVIGKMAYLYNSTTSYFPFSGNIQDVRVYNHALSPKEVKDISLGLRIHYPMNHFGVKKNLLPSTNQGARRWGLSYQNGLGEVSEVEIDGIRACKLTMTTASTGWQYGSYNLDLSVLKNSTDYVLSFDLYSESSNNYEYVLWASIKKGDATQALTPSVAFNIKEGWNRCVAVIPTNAVAFSGQILYFIGWNVTGLVTIIKNLKLELGGIETPWIPAEADLTEKGKTFSDYFDADIEYDSTGYGNDIIIDPLVAPSRWEYSGGLRNGGYDFSGDDYLSIPKNIFKNLTNFSISFWIYSRASTTGAVICCRAGIGYGLSIFKLYDNRLRFDTGDNNTYQWTTSYILPSNTWVHCTFVRDEKNNRRELYVNGDSLGSVAVIGNMNTFSEVVTTIGASQVNGSGIGNILNGFLSDLRLYATALSAEDVKSLYKASFSTDNKTVFVPQISEELGKVSIGKRSVLSATNVDEIGNLLDMGIKITDDGKVWAEIFFQDCSAGVSLFTADNVTNIQNKYLYSRLNLMEEFRGSDNKFEFRLEYPAEYPNQYNQWKQSSNPCVESIANDNANAASIFATGYEAIHIDWSGNYWGGLTRSTTPSTFIDGAVGHSDWWFAIGSYTKYSSGVPGPSTTSVSVVKLFVRIDNLPEMQRTRIFNKYISTNQFNEI